MDGSNVPVVSSHRSSHSDLIEVSMVCDNENKNETSDHLFGPGRTLGKVYDFAGHYVDVFLSQTAERMGYGPRVTAQRIRRRRAVVIHAPHHVEGRFCWGCHHAKRDAKKFTRSPASIKKKKEKIEKDIQSLLKYVNSKVPLTQKQAMDQILDLSTSDDDLRALLKSKGATQIISNSVQVCSKFRFSDFDDLLLSSSRKALVSLADAEINALLQEWIAVARRGFSDEIDETIVKRLWNRIAPYLHDPETAFLVMRIFRRIVETSLLPPMDYVISSIAKPPYYFEWEECDAVFCTTLYYLLTWRMPANNFLGDWVLRNADKMPRLLKSQSLQRLAMDIAELDLYSFQGVHGLKYSFMKSIISTWGNNEHTLSLDALKRKYTYPDVQPLLGALACPLERVVIDFVASRGYVYETIPTSADFRVYNEIASYIDSANDTLRIKAWKYVNFFLSVDIFRCNMMLQVLSATSFGTRDDFSSFKETTRKQCIPKESGYNEYTFYRHLDGNDNQIHLYDEYGRSCSCDVGDEEMTYDRDWTLRMRVERGTAFSSAGLYPLVAGYGIGGKCVSAAWAYFNAFQCIECHIYVKSMLSTVTEGMKPEDLRIEVSCPHLKAQIIPKCFEVSVLRYAPDAYPKALGTDEGGVDATGPFSWRPAREHKQHREKYWAKVVLAEDAMVGEEIPDEADELLGDRGRTGSDPGLDELELHSCDEEGEVESSSQSDEAISELEMSELVSQSCDDIPKTDTGLAICDGGMEPSLISELDGLEGKARLDSEINELEHHSSVEENRDESGSLQSDEVEFSSCEGGDETGTDLKSLETGQLDSPLDPDVESIDIDPSTCDGRTVTRTASESDGLAVDETGGQAIAPGARCTGVARFSMTVFHLAIVAVLSFALGFIFKAYI